MVWALAHQAATPPRSGCCRMRDACFIGTTATSTAVPRERRGGDSPWCSDIADSAMLIQRAKQLLT
eukprot:1584913-Pyramimonas_sp.AAC.1